MKRATVIGMVMGVTVSIAMSGCVLKDPEGVTPIPNLDPPVVRQDSNPTELERGTPGPRTTTTPVSPPERGSTLPPDGPVNGEFLLPNDEGTPLPSDRFDRENMVEDREFFREQTVYFDFDRSTIKAAEQGKVEAVANFLKYEPDAFVEVEGHCDERGTEEYNRSLGELRALALREFLANLGINPSRVSTISYGENRPAVEGTTEEAYALNRRGVFVLLRPKT